MPIALDPLRFVLIALAGWMNHRQLQVIEYLQEENRVLREQLGQRRLRLSDDQRRRLAARAKGLGRKLLRDVVWPGYSACTQKDVSATRTPLTKIVAAMQRARIHNWSHQLCGQ